MKIENLDRIGGVPISDIKVGECFMYDDCLHTKVNLGSLEYNNIDEFPNVILNLENNKMNAVIDSVKVKRIDVKIVIE